MSTRRDLYDTEEQYRTVIQQQTPQRNDNTNSFFKVLARINVALNTIQVVLCMLQISFLNDNIYKLPKYMNYIFTMYK